MDIKSDGKRHVKDMRKQLELCKILMDALARDFEENSKRDSIWSWILIENSTQMSTDARRLRRELLKLIKLFERRNYK